LNETLINAQSTVSIEEKLSFHSLEDKWQVIY